MQRDPESGDETAASTPRGRLDPLIRDVDRLTRPTSGCRRPEPARGTRSAHPFHPLFADTSGSLDTVSYG